MIVIPAWLAGRLVEERRDHFSSLRDRERELERLSRRLELALDASKVGVWDFNIDTQELVWDDRMNELYNYPCDGGVREYRHWRDRLDKTDVARAIADFETAMRNRAATNRSTGSIWATGERGSSARSARSTSRPTCPRRSSASIGT